MSAVIRIFWRFTTVFVFKLSSLTALVESILIRSFFGIHSNRESNKHPFAFKANYYSTTSIISLPFNQPFCIPNSILKTTLYQGTKTPKSFVKVNENRHTVCQPYPFVRCPWVRALSVAFGAPISLASCSLRTSGPLPLGKAAGPIRLLNLEQLVFSYNKPTRLYCLV